MEGAAARPDHAGDASRGHECRDERQEAQDAAVATASPQASLDRAASKVGANYKNAHWDLVDAVAEEKVDLAKLADGELPENMQGMDAEQRVAYIAEQAAKRTEIQAKIKELTAARNQYVAAERERLHAEAGEADLGQAMLTAVRGQLKEMDYDLVDE